MRVRGASADLLVRREGLTTIGAERAPELGIVVGQAVGGARPAGPQICPGVVPRHCELTAGRIQRELGQELAVLGGVVVHPHWVAPGGTVVIRVTDEDIRVVALVLLLQRVDQVDAPAMWAAGAIPSAA